MAIHNNTISINQFIYCQEITCLVTFSRPLGAKPLSDNNRVFTRSSITYAGSLLDRVNTPLVTKILCTLYNVHNKSDSSADSSA